MVVVTAAGRHRVCLRDLFDSNGPQALVTIRPRGNKVSFGCFLSPVPSTARSSWRTGPQTRREGCVPKRCH